MNILLRFRPTIAKAQRAFTLTELMVAMSIGLIVVAAAMVFLDFSGKYMSGITASTIQNERAAYALELIQSRCRLATSVTNNSTGTALILGFDTNYTADSDADGTPYNDVNYKEQFEFKNGDGNDTTTTNNSLVYIPRVGTAKTNIVISRDVRQMQNTKIFSLTNLNTTVLIRFGVIDSYARDHYQGVEIRAAAVSFNRPSITNIIAILPNL